MKGEAEPLVPLREITGQQALHQHMKCQAGPSCDTRLRTFVSETLRPKTVM